MKHPLLLLLGILLCSGGITTASAETRKVTALCRHHRHWVPGHYVWRHHHRHWVPEHYFWR